MSDLIPPVNPNFRPQVADDAIRQLLRNAVFTFCNREAARLKAGHGLWDAPFERDEVEKWSKDKVLAYFGLYLMHKEAKDCFELDCYPLTPIDPMLPALTPEVVNSYRKLKWRLIKNFRRYGQLHSELATLERDLKALNQQLDDLSQTTELTFSEVPRQLAVGTSLLTTNENNQASGTAVPAESLEISKKHLELKNEASWKEAKIAKQQEEICENTASRDEISLKLAEFDPTLSAQLRSMISTLSKWVSLNDLEPAKRRARGLLTNLPEEGETLDYVSDTKESKTDDRAFNLAERYRHALTAFGEAEQSRATTSERFTRAKAWEWVKENYTDYKFTNLATFSSYVTKARRAVGKNVNKRRVSPVGRSVVRKSEI